MTNEEIKQLVEEKIQKAIQEYEQGLEVATENDLPSFDGDDLANKQNCTIYFYNDTRAENEKDRKMPLSQLANLVANQTRKNLAINGNFNVWQRGEIINNISSKEYTADKWFAERTEGSQLDITREGFFLQATRREGNTDEGDIAIATAFEKETVLQIADGKAVFSFETLLGSGFSGDGDQLQVEIHSTSLEGQEATIDGFATANTVLKTAPVGEKGVLKQDVLIVDIPENSKGLAFVAKLKNAKGTAENDFFKIGKFKLEKNTINTEFEPEIIEEILPKARATFQRIDKSFGMRLTTLSKTVSNKAIGSIFFDQKLRVPAVNFSNVNDFVLKDNGDDRNINNIEILSIGKNSVCIEVTATSNLGSASSIMLCFKESENGYIDISCEL